MKSVITIAQHIPVGAFRCVSNTPVQYMDMLVLRKMDKIAYRLAEELEIAGHPTFAVPAQETEWAYKRASYGRLSTRHLGVESGLGTLGLEVNILTAEFGPRIYLTGILTELALAADAPMTEQVCIGESCSRCLHSCPGDAVLHFGIDKRACAQHAQEFGFSTILKFLDRVFNLFSPETFGWAAVASLATWLMTLFIIGRGIATRKRCTRSLMSFFVPTAKPEPSSRLWTTATSKISRSTVESSASEICRPIVKSHGAHFNTGPRRENPEALFTISNSARRKRMCWRLGGFNGLGSISDKQQVHEQGHRCAAADNHDERPWRSISRPSDRGAREST